MAGSAVEDQIHVVAERRGDMRGFRRAQRVRPVGAGRGDRHGGRFEQGLCNWVRRHPYGQRFETGARQQRDRAVRGTRQDQGERTGPKGFGQLSRQVSPVYECMDGFGRGAMHDQGVEVRAAFRLEDPGDSPILGGVCAQAVHGLRREGDEAPVAETRRGFRNSCRVGIKQPRQR